MNTQKYRCLIVDDEPIARQILRTYVEQMPNLACAGECKNAFEAIEQINADPSIQVLLLDINMPNLSGMALVRILSRQLQVIFTTAYSEFAVESYELNAADYLLKPFLFERFAQAIFKAVARLQVAGQSEEGSLPPPFFLKSGGEIFQVPVSEILFCEAQRNATRVVLRDGRVLVPLTAISKLEADLQQAGAAFLRVHRSFLVSKNHLGALGSNYLMVEQFKIPVGQQYKSGILAALGLR